MINYHNTLSLMSNSRHKMSAGDHFATTIFPDDCGPGYDLVRRTSSSVVHYWEAIKIIPTRKEDI